MKCIHCGSPDTRVSESAKTGKKVLRRRECKSCGQWFCTEEIAADIASRNILKHELQKIRKLNRKKGA